MYPGFPEFLPALAQGLSWHEIMFVCVRVRVCRVCVLRVHVHHVYNGVRKYMQNGSTEDCGYRERERENEQARVF